MQSTQTDFMFKKIDPKRSNAPRRSLLSMMIQQQQLVASSKYSSDPSLSQREHSIKQNARNQSSQSSMLPESVRRSLWFDRYHHQPFRIKERQRVYESNIVSIYPASNRYG
ncbi:uncharacterized protein VTP21DRAFT_257 [Calcarisporiella thermophila]|uniref:uncharacterized protein n=1 Tax=Calcarisporiella thermophila TaxID=911321 RepID=UPI0037432C00